MESYSSRERNVRDMRSMQMDVCAWCGNPIDAQTEEFADHGGYQIHYPVCTTEWDAENEWNEQRCVELAERATCACQSAERE
jgi:hypothetical protein